MQLHKKAVQEFAKYEKINFAIVCLEMAFKSFLYGYIQPNERGHSAAFLGGSDFNSIKWEPIQNAQCCRNLQLLHGYNSDSFPMIIATNG